MHKYNENFIEKIPFEDYQGIIRLAKKDALRQNGGFTGTRAFIDIFEEDLIRLDKIHGDNGNQNSKIIVFDSKKQSIIVGKEKNILINIFTYIKEDNVKNYQITDKVVCRNAVFNDDMYIIDCIVESYNDSTIYLNSLFSMYNELFRFFFDETDAEALAVLSTSFQCNYDYSKLNEAFIDDFGVDQLFNSHCIDQQLIDLLKNINNKLESEPSDVGVIREFLENY